MTAQNRHSVKSYAEYKKKYFTLCPTCEGKGEVMAFPFCTSGPVVPCSDCSKSPAVADRLAAADGGEERAGEPPTVPEAPSPPTSQEGVAR